jgi:hypothetical protein
MPHFLGHLLELPLTTTQDYALFHYLDDYSIELWVAQAEAILSRHGLVSFIAHPDYLREPRACDIYRQLLRYVDRLRTERHVWLAPPSAIDRWWRDRQAMRLVPDGAGWHVEGPGSERARVAYARLDEGGSACTFEVTTDATAAA